MEFTAYKKIIITSAIAFILSACGSGDSDGDSSSSTPITPAVQQYQVSTSTSSGGSISPTSATVDQGETTSFSITAAENYVLDSVSGCNGTLSNESFTISAITENCEIQANFIETNSVSGIAQLGLISGGAAKLYKLPEMTLLSETQTSSDSSSYGAFTFSDVVLADEDYYLIEISGGIDTDPNDDGIVIEEEMIEIKGKVRAITTGTQLLENTIRVTALSDIIYHQFDVKSSELEINSEKLDLYSKAISADLNSDGILNYQDILMFNPLIDANKIKLNYQTISQVFIPSIYLGLTKTEQLASLIYLYDFNIDVSVQEFEIVPFDFSVNIPNLPEGTSVEWLVNDKQYLFSNNYPVTSGGNVNIVANLSYNNETIGQIKKTIHAADTLTVNTGEANATENLYIDLNNNFGAGAGVNVPAGATTENIIIEVKKVIEGVMPVDSSIISDTIVLYPAGATFEKPVTIALPYYSDKNPENFRIVRYSDNGDKDYLYATRIDTQKKLIYFETQHFTTFTVEDGCDWNWNKVNCEKLESDFSEIKDLIKEHYKGDIDYESWNDELWEIILNINISGLDEGATIYDSFLHLKNTRSLVQVLDGTYANNEYPNGIDLNYKYLTAYKFLYPDDATIKAAQQRWEDIAKGLKFINGGISSVGVGISEQGVGDIIASSLGLIGIPVDASSTASFVLDLLNVPTYDPVALGGMLIGAFDQEAFNAQITRYFQQRVELPPLTRANLTDFLLVQQSTLNGEGDKLWFGSDYSGIQALNSTGFFSNVEDMYQYYVRYKNSHENNLNSCGDETFPCELNLSILTPEASFIALLMSGYEKASLTQEQEYLKDNPSFTIKSYQVNSGIEQDYDSAKGLQLSTEVGNSITVRFTIDVAGDEQYINEFNPIFTIEETNCNFYDACDDLQGLSYSFTHYTFNEVKTVEVDFIVPAYADTYIFNMELDNESYDIKDKLTIQVNQVNQNQAPTANIQAFNYISSSENQTVNSETILTPGNNLKLEAIATDDDGTINNYEWIVWLGDELIKQSNNKDFADILIPEVDFTKSLTVYLNVTDNGGKLTVTSLSLPVHPLNSIPPIANAGADQSITSNQYLILDASGSSDDEDNSEQLNYEWRQIDETPYGFYFSTMNAAIIQSKVHEITESAVLVYELKVTDSIGNSATDIVNITLTPEGAEVLNSLPIANANNDQSVISNSTVFLNGAESSDTDGDPLTFEWIQTDESPYQVTLQNTNSVTPSFTAPNVTETTALTFKLTVKDELGSSTDSVTITVEPVLAASPKFTNLSPTSVIAGTKSVTFTITGENLPLTLAASLQDSINCSIVTVSENKTTASITCDIPSNEKPQLEFYVKDKPELEGGSVISGAESLTVNVAENNGNGFIQPCKDCGNSGPFNRGWLGHNLEHLAQDYPAFVGDEVLAIARGRVVKIEPNQGGFGGTNPSLPGGVIIVMHTKANGDNFHALYGHVNAITNLAVDDIVLAEEVLGTVGHYYVGTENGQEDWPHLHFGIWDAETDFPTTQLGYGPIRSFVDPVPFLSDIQPETLSQATAISPQTATKGVETTFTLTGANLPSSIAMSLAGSLSCNTIYDYDLSLTSVKIDCTPNLEGEQYFYAKNKSGGIPLRGSEQFTVTVQTAQANDTVLGITFTDQNFATCVQEHVTSQQVTSLSELTTLDCSNRGIIDVSELSYMTDLTSLYLQNNPIVNISLDANQSLNTVNLLNTSLTQQALDYLATVTWVSNLNYLGEQPTEPITGTGKLNDTGITTCSDVSSNGLACPVTDYPNQDAENGRDAQAAAGTLVKVGAGAAGFDFTKLDANGNALSASATNWSCVQDNVTGLIWEVKTPSGSGGIHDASNTYRWGGKTAQGLNHPDKEGTYYDDWNTLLDGTITENLCGFNDWRVPSVTELMSIVDYSTTAPTVDVQYFPNTVTNLYWSSSADAYSSSAAWYINFNDGNASSDGRGSTNYVLLVRGGQ